MRTALGYLRISKEEDGSLSLDYQRAEILKLAEKEGYRLIGLETDEGISGKSISKRPAVLRLLDAVDARAVDAVILYKSDRLSRNGLESLQIESLFQKRGVELISCTEGRLASGNLEDEFMSFIRAGLNQRERKLIAMRTKQALSRKRERGEKLGGECPYGFTSVDGILALNPEEQRVIAKITNLNNKRFSLRQIVSWLGSHGYRNRRGQYFSKTSIERILKRAA